jgi:hypothetical protein
MPVVPVIALKVERAADFAGEDFVIAQIGRVLPQLLKVVSSYPLLDLIPLFRSLT